MIPFCKPSITELERRYMAEAADGGHICGDGPFTARASALLRKVTGLGSALLTTSCTHALELAALLADIGPGDEVILPSFTFTSTANAFRLRGAALRFCEVDPNTMNADVSHMASLAGPKTRALAPIDYAGVPCDIDPMRELADRLGIVIIEDAAQAVGSRYRGRPVGSDADMACFSFHETKNYVMGEGGAITFRGQALEKRAEVIREKGTDRSAFYRGEVDKYTWQGAGSSYLPSDVLSAMLLAQLERFDEIMVKRLRVWNRYYDALAGLEASGDIRRPHIPEYAAHNAHIFYILLGNQKERDGLLGFLREHGVGAVFHYIPLHSSPAGLADGNRAGDLPVTESAAARLLRLPLFPDLADAEIDHVTESVRAYFS